MAKKGQKQQTWTAWQPPAVEDDETVPKLPLTMQEDRFKFNKKLGHIQNSYARVAGRAFEARPGTETLIAGYPNLKLIPHPLSDFRHRPRTPSRTAVKTLPLYEQAQYQRLQLAFDWLICRVSSLMLDINNAVRAGAVPAYKSAYDAYTAFTANLANHSPKGNQIAPWKGFGYGLNLKRTSIEALVERKSRENIITGARIQVEWNPLISSSCFPVRHRHRL